MIVTCASCQTRFRIADEKIGPRGAKVRCGRCKALFVVRRAEPAPSEPVPAPPAAAAEPAPPPAPPPPAPPPADGTQGLDIELTSDPFALPRPRRDDPFARLATPDPFAPSQSDPFAATATPSDPFAAPPADPFQASHLTPPSSLAGAAEPPPAPPAEVTSPGGIALEEAVRRSPPTPMPGFDTAFGLPADFRTPGPSGLEVAAGTGEVAPAQVPEPLPPPAPPPPRAAAPPPPAPEPVPEPAPPLARRAASVLVNSASLVVLLVLAGALFVYWKGGGTAAVWATLGRGSDGALAARNVRSGLYDTASGKPALFVRGEVVAAGGSLAPVRVRVELLDAGRKVAGAEGLSGALPTPEEIWSVATPEAEARLRAELRGRGARLEPQRPAPFLVVLWDHPADLRGLDVRVVAEPDAGR
ncbi:MAG: zinc-ribbon domain-containing protein [Deltaproteobacteria bacterium]|nr:zinc-ribbon domain-containing protein [Deltaproteobacteria bacterium]